MSKIDRIEAPSSKNLLEYIENNTPVIITKAISAWKALTSWDIDYLKTKSSPEKLVSVYNQPIRGNTLLQIYQCYFCAKFDLRCVSRSALLDEVPRLLGLLATFSR
jgi:hypothetical protein